MLIKLTNANPAHKNRDIVINADAIVSIHRNITTREDGSIEEVTFVHCPPHGTWEVTQTIEEVLSLISGEPVKKSTKKIKV
jgi:prephenate dehydratase